MLRQNGPILILSWISGWLDALSYLGLGRVFTANMTGNTVLLGLSIAQGNWISALRPLIALAGFGLGVVSSTLFVKGNHQLHQQTWTPQLTRALALEGFLLLIFALGWSLLRLVPLRIPIADALIGVSALAMGQQSATIFSMGIPGISTTYITGTITTLLANLVQRFPRLAPRSFSPFVPPAHAHIISQKPIRLASIWLLYIIAAILAAYGELHFPILAAYLPLLAILVVLIMNRVFGRG